MTPLLQRCAEISFQHPGVSVLFRVGDFRQAFGDDAIVLAGVLELRILRFLGQAMIGWPEQATASYLARLEETGVQYTLHDFEPQTEQKVS